MGKKEVKDFEQNRLFRMDAARKWHFPKSEEFQAAMEKSRKECVDLTKYQKLSTKVHSTHRQFEATANNFMERSYSSVYVDCNVSVEYL